MGVLGPDAAHDAVVVGLPLLPGSREPEGVRMFGDRGDLTARDDIHHRMLRLKVDECVVEPR